jgi:hypothetical protein
MNKEKKHRIILAIIFGVFFGLICAFMATIRKPVEITFLLLITTIYTRTLAGLFIGLLGEWVIVDNSLLNILLRGFIIGFLVSLPMALPFGGSAAIGFGLFGGIYGLIIDYMVSKELTIKAD